MKYRINFKISVLLLLISGGTLALFFTVILVILLRDRYLPLSIFLCSLMLPALGVIAVVGSFSWRLYLDDATIRISAIGAKAICVSYENIVLIAPQKNFFIKGGHGSKKGNIVIWYCEGCKEELENICFGFNQENYLSFIEAIRQKNSKISIQSPFSEQTE